jgi:hypothetical protein
MLGWRSFRKITPRHFDLVVVNALHTFYLIYIKNCRPKFPIEIPIVLAISHLFFDEYKLPLTGSSLTIFGGRLSVASTGT